MSSNSPSRSLFGRELRTLLVIAWPLMVASSFTTIQIFIDRLLLSWYTTDAVSASMGSAMVFYTLFILLFSTANYVVTFVAQYTGANRPKRVGAAVWQGIWFGTITGLAFTSLWFVSALMMRWIGHPPAIQEMEAVYFRCLCFAALPMLITAAVSSFFAGRGESSWVMLINFVGTVVNGVLDYAMIFGHWGLPEMGVAGAGWATVIGSWASALLALGLFMRRRYREEYGTVTGWRFDPTLFKRMMWFGLPSGVQWFLDTTAFTMFVIIIGWLGESAANASNIAFTINLVAFLPVIGIGQAVTIRVGQFQGEGNSDAAARATWAGLLISAVYTSTVAVLYLGWPEMIANLFRSDPPPADWAAISSMVSKLLIFISVYCFFDGMMMVFCFALRGAGDTRFVTLISLLLSWPVMVIPTYLAWKYDWGLFWAWAFSSTYIIIAACCFGLRFLWGKWKTMKVIEPEVIETEVRDPDPEVVAV